MIETQNLKKWYIISVSILFALILVLSTFLIYILTENNAENIFRNNQLSVVEVKCSTLEVGEAYGTGVIIKNDGEFVTNAHVVSYTKLGVDYTFETFEVRFINEEDYREAELIKFDETLDIAVLKIVDLPSKVIPAILGDSSNLNYGEIVYALGNGSNYGLSLTTGIISMPLVNVSYEENIKEVIQCDLTISAGNSGGALLDSNGRLIGITTFRTKDTSGDVIYGIAYSIPIQLVIDYVNEESV